MLDLLTMPSSLVNPISSITFTFCFETKDRSKDTKSLEQMTSTLPED